MKKFAKVMCAVLAVALVSVLFTGCVLTAEKATEKLEKKEYKVISSQQDSVTGKALAALLTNSKLENVVSGTKTEDDKLEAVIVFYYKNKDDAKAAKENEDQFKKDMKNIMELLRIEEDANNPFVFKQSGNAVVMGTEKAVKVVA